MQYSSNLAVLRHMLGRVTRTHMHTHTHAHTYAHTSGHMLLKPRINSLAKENTKIPIETEK